MPRGYPREPRTVGEQIRQRRMDLGQTQRTLARRWGVRTETLASWERRLRKPSARQWPRILDLLGDDPQGGDGGLLARLESARRRLGVTRREFAELLGLSEGTISRWIAGRRRPRAGTVRRVESALMKRAPR